MKKTLLAGSLAAAIFFAFAYSASADAPKRPKILGVAHIALFVHDIEKSRAFYKDFLGYGEPFKLDNADGSLSLTFLKINERQYIELFPEDRKSTRLNSSHRCISYAVFCLKKKKKTK